MTASEKKVLAPVFVHQGSKNHCSGLQCAARAKIPGGRDV